MSTSVPPLKLLRYLFVLRINSNLVRLPACPALEFSHTLAAMIADRLPTQEARLWRKALNRWGGYQDPSADEGGMVSSPPQKQPTAENQATTPDVGWPIDVVLHLYPGKRSYGQGELLLWEIKLLGESADHRIFLELLLPTLETASLTRDPRWCQSGSLWGHFDLATVYVAQGPHWLPLVQAERVDLTMQPTATQWASGLPLASPQPRKTLTWVTPFALGDYATDKVAQPQRQRPKQHKATLAPPNLATLLRATEQRLNALTAGWLNNSGLWRQAVAQAQTVPVLTSDLQPAPKHWPGQGIGSQTFAAIPATLVPFLTLASLVHLGAYTHLGCGTFLLER